MEKQLQVSGPHEQGWLLLEGYVVGGMQEDCTGLRVTLGGNTAILQARNGVWGANPWAWITGGRQPYVLAPWSVDEAVGSSILMPWQEIPHTTRKGHADKSWYDHIPKWPLGLFLFHRVRQSLFLFFCSTGTISGAFEALRHMAEMITQPWILPWRRGLTGLPCVFLLFQARPLTTCYLLPFATA